MSMINDGLPYEPPYRATPEQIASVRPGTPHVTDGGKCWCNPEVIHVPPNEGPESGWLRAPDPVLINISGVADEPLWVVPEEVAAIGMRGANDTLVVLKGSGTQLVAKSTYPNEVVQAVCGVPGMGNDQG